VSGSGGGTNVKHERRIILNANRMKTREAAHAHMKTRLRLPEWYGRNLDALNDCLGAIGLPARIVVRHAPLLERNLGDYGKKLLGVLERAAQENANLRLKIHARR
jgi:ribonuclease inhibitor